MSNGKWAETSKTCHRLNVAEGSRYDWAVVEGEGGRWTPWRRRLTDGEWVAWLGEPFKSLEEAQEWAEGRLADEAVALLVKLDPDRARVALSRALIAPLNAELDRLAELVLAQATSEVEDVQAWARRLGRDLVSEPDPAESMCEVHDRKYSCPEGQLSLVKEVKK